MEKVTAMLFSMAMGLNTVSTMAKAEVSEEQETNVLLINGDIMSTTLGICLRELEPEWPMTMVERLEGVAQESSNGWNNAETGHSTLMELSYTPQNADGSTSIKKAVAINEVSQISHQFWARRVGRGVLRTPCSSINTVLYMSFVWGEDNVNSLRARYAVLQQNSLFRGMRCSEDHVQIKEWAPLAMGGCDPQQKVTTTHTGIGTDVSYGEITRQLTTSLQKKSNFSLQLSSEVHVLKRNDDNTWTVTVTDLKNNTAQSIRAEFVFTGAGDVALKLLQESGIPETRGYAGLLVGRQFLVSENPGVVSCHLAKTYGKASVGASPMSVPHIGIRVLDGKRVVSFRPLATFSTKLLKNGSSWNLMSSTITSNVIPMMHVGLDNFDLVKYPVSQVMLSEEDRFEALKECYP